MKRGVGRESEREGGREGGREEVFVVMLPGGKVGVNKAN